MNINTTKTVLSVKDYVEDNVKCQKSSWQYKFNSSWNECDTWCDYINYYFMSNVLSQVYIIDSPHIPKGKKIGFAIPVKTYDTNLYSSFIFNKVERSASGVGDFLTGGAFTPNQDIQNAYLTFYLNPDVKIPHQYILNRYKATFFHPTLNLPVYMSVGKFMMNRNLFIDGTIKPKAQINLVADRYLSAVFDFKTDDKATVIRLSVKGYINAIADFSVYATSRIGAYRYLNPVAKLNITASPSLTAYRNYSSNGLLNIGSNTNCSVKRSIYANGLINFLASASLQYAGCDIWDDWDTWDDYDNWECLQTVSISSNGVVNIYAYNTLDAQRNSNVLINTYINSYSTLDTLRNLSIISNIPPTSSASIIECCNCWGDFNTWEDRSTWRCN